MLCTVGFALTGLAFPRFEDDAVVFQAQWPAGMKQKFVGEEHPQSFINWSLVEERHCNGEDPDVNTVDLLIVLEPIANGIACSVHCWLLYVSACI